MSSQTIFVVGATGIAGGAVARHLLSLNWRVHATTRDPDSEASKALQALGVKLSKGTWDDEEPLSTALAGCSTLFLNPYHYPFDTGEEIRWSTLILATAKAAGVTQVVLASMFGTQNPEKMRYQHPLITQVLVSKRRVEDLVRAAGFDFWTILRPGYFMANFLLPKVVASAGLVDAGRWTTALMPESPMPLIDEHDIAVFTAAALEDQVRFNKKEIELAGELQNPEEITSALSKASGRDIKTVYLTEEEVETQKANPFVGAYLALRDMHLYVDIDQVKSWGLRLGTFEGYLARKNNAVQKTYGLRA